MKVSGQIQAPVVLLLSNVPLVPTAAEEAEWTALPHWTVQRREEPIYPAEDRKLTLLFSRPYHIQHTDCLIPDVRRRQKILLHLNS